jgi:hypothetical protein
VSVERTATETFVDVDEVVVAGHRQGNLSNNEIAGKLPPQGVVQTGLSG